MPTNNLNLLTLQFYDKLPHWSFLDQIPTSVDLYLNLRIWKTKL